MVHLSTSSTKPVLEAPESLQRVSNGSLVVCAISLFMVGISFSQIFDPQRHFPPYIIRALPDTKTLTDRVRASKFLSYCPISTSTQMTQDKRALIFVCSYYLLGKQRLGF